MATFLVESKNHDFFLNSFDEEELNLAKAKLKEGEDKGAIKGCWAKVGGGSIWIIEGESHAALGRRLRELGVSEVEVTPLLDAHNLLNAHLEHRRST